MGQKPRAYQRFFAELKRRKVFNSAAIYGGVAFVVFQAADFVVPALRLSDTVATAIVIVAVVGFPIAMGFAWFFDLTPDGLSAVEPPQEGELDAIVAQPAVHRWPSGLAAAGGVILLFGGVGWVLWDRSDPTISFPPPELATETFLVAVPFSNLTGDSSAAPLSEGIAWELAESLRKIQGLSVLARTSRESFLASGPAVGSQDGFSSDLFLEGSVGDRGDEVELAIRLERPADQEDGNAAWTRTYRISKDEFLVGLDAVAWDIADELGAKGSDRGDGPLVFPGTRHFDAYRDYLQGRYLSRRGTPEALEAAIEGFHRALILDPDFGAAWSALAVAYILLPEYGGPPVPEIAPYAQAAVDHALGPGAHFPEGFAASGFLKWFYQWDFSGAEEDFKRSIESDPVHPVPRTWMARALTTQRRWEEAEELVREALEVDPMAPTAHLTLGLVLMCEGGDGAVEAFRQALDLAPKMHPAAFLLGTLLALEGDLEGAAGEFDRFATLTGDDPGPFRAYLAALSDPGKIPDAVSALGEATFFGPTESAALLAHLGETEAALTQLEEAARSRSPYFLWANALPQFSGMRMDPRFQGILAWAGF